jgi:hypothetical protein
MLPAFLTWFLLGISMTRSNQMYTFPKGAEGPNAEAYILALLRHIPNVPQRPDVPRGSGFVKTWKLVSGSGSWRSLGSGAFASCLTGLAGSVLGHEVIVVLGNICLLVFPL